MISSYNESKVPNDKIFGDDFSRPIYELCMSYKRFKDIRSYVVLNDVSKDKEYKYIYKKIKKYNSNQKFKELLSSKIKNSDSGIMRNLITDEKLNSLTPKLIKQMKHVFPYNTVNSNEQSRILTEQNENNDILLNEEFNNIKTVDSLKLTRTYIESIFLKQQKYIETLLNNIQIKRNNIFNATCNKKKVNETITINFSDNETNEINNYLNEFVRNYIEDMKKKCNIIAEKVSDFDEISRYFKEILKTDSLEEITKIEIDRSKMIYVYQYAVEIFERKRKRKRKLRKHTVLIESEDGTSSESEEETIIIKNRKEYENVKKKLNINERNYVKSIEEMYEYLENTYYYIYKSIETCNERKVNFEEDKLNMDKGWKELETKMMKTPLYNKKKDLYYKVETAVNTFNECLRKVKIVHTSWKLAVDESMTYTDTRSSFNIHIKSKTSKTRAYILLFR